MTCTFTPHLSFKYSLITFSMKREREGVEESIDLANCLMLLSNPRESKPQKLLGPEEFECRTCNRKFSSFQALGGHRASHKKPKLDVGKTLTLANKPNEPKAHECCICGQRFSLGQALGGHMKRHRIVLNQRVSSVNRVQVVEKIPVPKSTRVMRLLDLNLTPLQHDLKLLFGDKAPKVVDSFL
ncbi:hypothetical protein Fmac_027715 [Flemingia macrophylla]|uniref:C2H2-type domain-containing protein n=1 Tax=Flemingia macrophylla TaxID=520843 RepID=A0ABD1LIH9_9FABA